MICTAVVFNTPHILFEGDLLGGHAGLQPESIFIMSWSRGHHFQELGSVGSNLSFGSCDNILRFLSAFVLIKLSLSVSILVKAFSAVSSCYPVEHLPHHRKLKNGLLQLINAAFSCEEDVKIVLDSLPGICKLRDIC